MLKCYILLAIAGLAAAQNGPAPAAPGPPPKLVKIKDDLYLVQNPETNLAGIGAYGGNLTILLTNDGVVLVDSKNDKVHDDVVAKVKSLTDKPIKYVILTHNHGDHAAGAAKFEEMGATIISTVEDRENMARAKMAGLPQITFQGHAQVELGGKEIQLYEFRGHTLGDTVAYFPADKVIVLGDLLTTGDQIPGIVNYGDGGTWSDWRRSIDDILKMDFDTAIPGHGSPVTKAEVFAAREKYVHIQERVRALVREKKTQQEIQEALVKEFSWGMGPAAGNITGMMQEFR